MALDKNKIRQNVNKLLAAKKYNDAIRELNKLVEDDPRDINTLQTLGNTYLMAGMKEQAVPIFIRTAELYHKSGFTPKALASIKIALREAPDNVQALELYATFAEQTGLHRDSIEAYEKLVTIYWNQGFLDKSLNILEKLLELNPENVKYQLQHGDILVRLGKKEESIPSYAKAAKNLINQGKVAESAKIFERILQIDGKNIDIFVKTVTELLSLKEAQKALDLIDTLVGKREAPVAIDALKVDALIELNKLDEAEVLLKKISQKGPISNILLKKFVKLYISQNRLDNAIKIISSEIPKADFTQLKEIEGLFEEILTKYPSAIDVYNGLIVVQRKLGNKTKLAKTLSKYADILVDRRDYKTAENILKEALENSPNDIEIVNKLDEVREYLGFKPKQPQIEEQKIIVIEKEEEFKIEEESTKKETVQDISEDVEIEVEIEDISQEMPVIEQDIEVEEVVEEEVEIEEEVEEEKKEEEKVEKEELEIVVEEKRPTLESVEVTSTFQVPAILKTEEKIEMPIEEEKSVDFIDEEKEEEIKEELEREEVKEEKLEDKEIAVKIQERFSEAQIFLKYGLIEKAIAELQEVLKIVPNHIQAHQKLIGIYRQLDKKDKLVRQIVKLAQVFKNQGDNETAQNLIEEAMEIDPNHKALLEFTKPEKEVAVEEKPAIKELSELEKFIKIPKEKKEKVEKVKEEIPLIAEVKRVKKVEKEPEIEVELSEREEIEEVYLTKVEEEEKGVQKEEKEEFLESSIKEEEVKKEEFVEKESLKEEESLSIEFSEREVETFSELNEKIEEAEFYYAQELYEDANNICEELLKTYKDDPRVIELSAKLKEALKAQEEKRKEEERIKEVIEEKEKEEELKDELSLLDEELVKGLRVVPVAPRKKERVKVTLRDVLGEEKEEKKETVESQQEEYYDLAKELGAALEEIEEGNAEDLFEEEEPSEKMSFEEVFSEFKKGLEKKVSEEDYDTHYNLGIAYKEMELIDEAIAEFQIAARSPLYFADSCAMLGKCFQIKGMPDLAEKWYRRGLDSKGFPEDVYNGLRYDLAELLESQGRTKEALKLYKEVYASNANYREVRDKIESLK